MLNSARTAEWISMKDTEIDCSLEYHMYSLLFIPEKIIVPEEYGNSVNRIVVASISLFTNLIFL